MKDKIIIFEGSKIRRVWNEELEEWYFSIVDVVGVLSGSIDPASYWRKLKQRLIEEGNETVTNCHGLKMRAVDGKFRLTDTLTKQGIFRIIQSIPSKKAEPSKLWLAKIGSERIDEIENPELSIDRAMKNYLAKGYSEKWINQRLKTIEVRKELTDEWRKSGVQEGQEFAILTNEMTLAWSGKSIREYKMLKSLKRENLRDNMTNLELALNTLAEATTTEISKKEGPEGFDESLDVTIAGGNIAGNARRDIEKRLSKEVISDKNAEDILDEEEIEEEEIVVEEALN